MPRPSPWQRFRGFVAEIHPLPMLDCPCGNPRLYTTCCEPYILGTAIAPTAEALMRSRYSAYCRGNVDYLIATHHPSKRRLDSRHDLVKTINQVEWLKLIVVDTHQGTPQDAQGMVEFVAIYRVGKIEQLHERSQFVQQHGRWFYLEGEHLPPLWPKRNQPCWCGSSKKFKQCHSRIC